MLGDPAIGSFGVQQLVDARSYEVRRALERFFQGRERDDVLLLHLSCHGIKDDEGCLHFAVSDTDKDLPASTAVSAAFLHKLMERCRASTVVVLLDCCYSGVFLPGAKGDDYVAVKEELSGRGRVILTATNRTEYAWEGEHLEVAEPQPSRFTGALIEGLRSGEADTDRDGRISVTELYDYVYEKVRRGGARQTPRMWVDVEYRVTIARAAAVRDAEAAPDPVAAQSAQPAADGGPEPPLFERLRAAFNGDEGALEPEPVPAQDTREPAPHGLLERLKDTLSGGLPRQRPRRGQDAMIRMDVDLAEAAFGTTREIQADIAVICEDCAGAGTAPGTQAVECRLCEGSGEASLVRSPCPDCYGMGVTIPSPCPRCLGDGRVRTRRTLTTNIPAGVNTGMRVHLAGEGDVGPGGGTAADLYIEIHERPHPELERRGDHLHVTRRIGPDLARNGGTIPVPTLDGVKSVRIPKGQPTGLLRLRGLGMGRLRALGGGRGDLYVHVQVDDDTGTSN